MVVGGEDDRIHIRTSVEVRQYPTPQRRVDASVGNLVRGESIMTQTQMHQRKRFQDQSGLATASALRQTPARDAGISGPRAQTTIGIHRQRVRKRLLCTGLAVGAQVKSRAAGCDQETPPHPTNDPGR